MNNFKQLIEEDIRHYQKDMPNVGLGKIKNDSWAFNFWVLDKLYSVDEEIIESQIVDIHDLGIDAFEIYEETKDVFLIQNKYYSEETLLDANYVKNDFLINAVTALENGTYPKSDELQSFFNKYKNYPEFKVYLRLYITNNKRCLEADQYIKKFNVEHPRYIAEIYYLADIEESYYNTIPKETKNIEVQIHSVNNGTILKVNTSDYKLKNVFDARYVLTPVSSLYNIYCEAVKQRYPIFDKNIREYLGNKKVNKGIYNTLMDVNDRKNFFYYNNGITMICDEMGSIETKNISKNVNVTFKVKNPQIVNGCQTVNSIYEVLKNIDPQQVDKEFEDTFVMLKILQIDSKNSTQQELYKDIVRYNNSQNSIDEKSFVANADIFKRLQKEFLSRGFLLLIKQSDKNKFKKEYKDKLSVLVDKNNHVMSLFGLSAPTDVTQMYIELEKLMQVINAFAVGATVAYTKKINMLKFGSEQYNKAIDFIKRAGVTIDTLIALYMLFKRAEQDKKDSKDGRTPIPYYLIDCFAKFECQERKAELILSVLSDKSNIDKIMRFYAALTKAYTLKYFEMWGIDYNKMIKQDIDYELLTKEKEFVDVLKSTLG